MLPSELTGARLDELLDAASVEENDRDDFYRALLVEPLCVAGLGPGASQGPTLRIGGGPPPGPPGPTPPVPRVIPPLGMRGPVAAPPPPREAPPEAQVRLGDSPRLGAPVVRLAISGAAMVEDAHARGLWPDRVERGVVYEAGVAFTLLRGHPGTIIVGTRHRSADLDAGEVAALAERLTPGELSEELRKLIASGRPREAARRLAGRPLYTLGHPHGGMLMFQRDLPVFLRLGAAERFAARLAQQNGTRSHQGLVAAAELFKNAVRGKLHVLVDPGPLALRFRPDDLR